MAQKFYMRVDEPYYKRILICLYGMVKIYCWEIEKTVSIIVLAWIVKLLIEVSLMDTYAGISLEAECDLNVTSCNRIQFVDEQVFWSMSFNLIIFLFILTVRMLCLLIRGVTFMRCHVVTDNDYEVEHEWYWVIKLRRRKIF